MNWPSQMALKSPVLPSAAPSNLKQTVKLWNLDKRKPPRREADSALFRGGLLVFVLLEQAPGVSDRETGFPHGGRHCSNRAVMIIPI